MPIPNHIHSITVLLLLFTVLISCTSCRTNIHEAPVIIVPPSEFPTEDEITIVTEATTEYVSDFVETAVGTDAQGTEWQTIVDEIETDTESSIEPSSQTDGTEVESDSDESVASEFIPVKPAESDTESERIRLPYDNSAAQAHYVSGG